jgi:type II secretory pathway component GspD/PulD (secretin)
MDWFEEIGLDLDLYFNTNDDMLSAAQATDPFFSVGDFFNDPAAGGGAGRAIPTNPFYWVSQDAYNADGGPPPGTRPILPTGTDIVNGIPIPGYTDPGTPGWGAPVGNQGGWDPIAVSQDSLGLIQTLGGALSSSVAQAALVNPALAVGLSFVDDIQVDLLIEATQADQRNSVLTAPRLTLFNGQRSWISVAEGITYISDLVPVTGDSSGAFDPITNVVYSGFVLDIEGVISADRRYVTMTVSFNLNQNVEFEDIPVTGAAGGGGANGGGRAANFFGVIQLPRLQGTQIRTTVSVPDKGTILLGGQRTVTEVEIEAGVPVLSKIPIVNRFFTNRLTSKEEMTMLLLIRPEIIIQRENEDELFPGLSEQLGTGSGYSGF